MQCLVRQDKGPFVLQHVTWHYKMSVRLHTDAAEAHHFKPIYTNLRFVSWKEITLEKKSKPELQTGEKRSNIRMVHLVCIFHSLVGCKQAKQPPNTQGNDPHPPRAASRPYLRKDRVSSGKRKLVPQTDWHSQQIPFKLFELSFLGTCVCVLVLLYWSGVQWQNAFELSFGSLGGEDQSVAYPYVAFADLAWRIKCRTLDSYIHFLRHILVNLIPNYSVHNKAYFF